MGGSREAALGWRAARSAATDTVWAGGLCSCSCKGGELVPKASGLGSGGVSRSSRGEGDEFGALHPAGAALPSPGPREAEIASAFNYSLSAYQMLVHLLHMNAD